MIAVFLISTAQILFAQEKQEIKQSQETIHVVEDIDSSKTDSVTVSAQNKMISKSSVSYYEGNKNKLSTSTEDKEPVNKNRNVMAVGYQIGGFTLIGINLEYRISDVLGLHGGVGFTGYTLGVKLHTNKQKNSPFFNLSYKDGGLGVIDAAALEFGGRWVWNKKNDLGLHYQFGIAKILEIDEAFERDFFGDEGAPNAMLSIGVGVSW